MISFTVMKVDYLHQLLYFYLCLVSLITSNPSTSKAMFNSNSLEGEQAGSRINSPLLHLGVELRCTLHMVLRCAESKVSRACSDFHL